MAPGLGLPLGHSNNGSPNSLAMPVSDVSDHPATRLISLAYSTRLC